MGNWSSGMIPASGAGGHEFDSRITPLFLVLFENHPQQFLLASTNICNTLQQAKCIACIVRLVRSIPLSTLPMRVLG